MNKKILTCMGLLLMIGVLVGLVLPVSASSDQPQAVYLTPTPDQDGRVIYVVQPNDTCSSITLWTGVDANKLRELNKLDENCTLIEGQKLVLTIIEAQVPTAGPSGTPEQQVPTLTPFPGSGQICIFLFEDLNGNGLAESTELPIAEGAVSITDREVKISQTGSTTTSVDPLCFSELPEGDYNISVAPPEGYNPTTVMNYPLKLMAGDSTYVDFGAQLSSSAEPPTPTEGGRSPLLGIVGAILVIAGAGLGVYIRFLKR